MYALALIVLFGIVATLMPFAVMPPPKVPVQETKITQTGIGNTPSFNKENVEQYIISMCNLRKSEGKTDLYPSCSNPSGCSASVLYYSDSTVYLYTMLDTTRPDGTSLMFKPVGSNRNCDASDFVF